MALKSKARERKEASEAAETSGNKNVNNRRNKFGESTLSYIIRDYLP